MKKGKAPGRDLILYEFISMCPQNLLDSLLDIYNVSWTSGEFPSQWKEAIIIPLLKSNKDSTNTDSYRQITLLPCLGKLMERLVEKRLTWLLEHNHVFRPELHGFRRKRSTTDCLIEIEHQIRNAQNKGEVLLCMFLDIKAAFDSVSHQGVLTQLSRLGVGGLPLRWFRN